LKSFQRIDGGKIQPQREQKMLALPLLARLYTNVGPMTLVGGSSRKMGDTLQEIYACGSKSPAKSYAGSTGRTSAGGPYSFIISGKKGIASTKIKVMQIAARYDTLEAR
jgi:hypothetical protein